VKKAGATVARHKAGALLQCLDRKKQSSHCSKAGSKEGNKVCSKEGSKVPKPQSADVKVPGVLNSIKCAVVKYVVKKVVKYLSRRALTSRSPACGTALNADSARTRAISLLWDSGRA
jgi:hypothetical protein